MWLPSLSRLSYVPWSSSELLLGIYAKDDDDQLSPIMSHGNLIEFHSLDLKLHLVGRLVPCPKAGVSHAPGMLQCQDEV